MFCTMRFFAALSCPALLCLVQPFSVHCRFGHALCHAPREPMVMHALFHILLHVVLGFQCIPHTTAANGTVDGYTHTTPANGTTADGYKLVAEQMECSATGVQTWPTQQTVFDCRDRCAETDGCQFFVYPADGEPGNCVFEVSMRCGHTVPNHP